MKKILFFTLLVSLIMAGPALMAQKDAKSGSVKRSDVKKSETTTQRSNEAAVTKEPVTAKPEVTSKEISMDGQKFYDQTGAAMAAIAMDGTIRDSKGRILGTYTNKGEYLNPHGKKVGYVEENIIRKVNGDIFATIRDDGRIYDGKSQYIGTISDDGKVINSKGMRIGSAPDIDKSVVVLMYFFPKNDPMPELRSVKQQ